jgi:hypothetical protein
MKPAAIATAIAAAALVHAPALAAQTNARPRYADAIEAELRSMAIAAECTPESAARHRCRATRAATAPAAALQLHVAYSDETDTIYFYLERYLVVPSDHPRVAEVLRRLMELNWDMLVGKFEWNPRTGEVRLSATLSTDSNFDRRAFRSVIAALDTAHARHGAELRDLAAR